CLSATECWAVGTESTGNTASALIEYFDGTVWSVISNPSDLPVSSYLTGVTCASAADCWAVGAYTPSGLANQTLIEHFDGTSWSLATSPNTSTSQLNVLQGVACTTGGQCMASGYYSGSSADQTLIEQ